MRRMPRCLHTSWKRPRTALPPRPTMTAFHTPSARWQPHYPAEGVFQPNSPKPPTAYMQQSPPNPPQFPSHIHPTETPRRNVLLRWRFLILGVLLTGYSFVTWEDTVSRLLPPPPPPLGSEEDEEILEELFSDFNDIPLVQQLREDEIEVDGRTQPAWEEWFAYEGLELDNDILRRRLTTGPMGGSGGVGAQIVFWNEERKSLFLFVNFGNAVCGWPSTVHGGALATICDEALGRVCIRSAAERSGMTASLEINYQDRVEPGGWYVVIAGPDATKENTERKFHASGVIACCGDNGPTFDGKVVTNVHPHVTAKALFVMPKGIPLKPIPDRF